MDLMDRARQFVKEGNPTELVPLLTECVGIGNNEGMLAVKLLARDMYGGETFNFELKAPAAHCLLAWGEVGLRALVENAMEEPTTKNFSLAFQVLAKTAEGIEPQKTGTWLHDADLQEAVSLAAGDWSSLAPAARRHLHELVLSIEDDDDADLYAAIALFALAVQVDVAARNLIHALALRSIAISPKVLASYDHLLSASGDDEPVFQRFLEAHPLLLDPRAFQVWGQPDFHGRFEPDFILRTYDNSYVVVEIETPSKLLITQDNQVSAATTHAINQVLQYKEYLRTHVETASRLFPNITAPSGLVVIGLESSLNESQRETLRVVNQNMTDIRIVGFDTLASTARAVTDNVIQGIPGAIRGARLP